MKKSFISIVLFWIVAGVILSSSVEAKEKKQLICSNGAEYLPHPSNPVGGEEGQIYKLRVELNSSHHGPAYNAVAFFTLDIFDGNKNLLAQFKMDYATTGGAMLESNLFISDKPSGVLPVKLLAADFGLSNFFNKQVPYAIIIPNASSRFGSIDWGSSKDRLKNYTDNAVKPDFKMPSIWIFNQCLK